MGRKPVSYLDFWQRELKPAVQALSPNARQRFAVACANRSSLRYRVPKRARRRPSLRRMSEELWIAIDEGAEAIDLGAQRRALLRLMGATAEAGAEDGSHRAVCAVVSAGECVASSGSLQDSLHAAEEAFYACTRGETLRSGEVLTYDGIASRERESASCQREIAYQRSLLHTLARDDQAPRTELMRDRED